MFLKGCAGLVGGRGCGLKGGGSGNIIMLLQAAGGGAPHGKCKNDVLEYAFVVHTDIQRT